MVIENENLQITPLLPSVPCMDGSVKIFIPISEGINKKNSMIITTLSWWTMRTYLGLYAPKNDEKKIRAVESKTVKLDFRSYFR